MPGFFARIGQMLGLSSPPSPATQAPTAEQMAEQVAQETAAATSTAAESAATAAESAATAAESAATAAESAATAAESAASQAEAAAESTAAVAANPADELARIIQEKVGLDQGTATQAASTSIDFLKSKLPPELAGVLEGQLPDLGSPGGQLGGTSGQNQS